MNKELATKIILDLWNKWTETPEGMEFRGLTPTVTFKEPSYLEFVQTYWPTIQDDQELTPDQWQAMPQQSIDDWARYLGIPLRIFKGTVADRLIENADKPVFDLNTGIPLPIIDDGTVSHPRIMRNQPVTLPKSEWIGECPEEKITDPIYVGDVCPPNNS